MYQKTYRLASDDIGWRSHTSLSLHEAGFDVEVKPRCKKCMLY